MIDIQTGAIYLLNITSNLRYLARVMEYAPHWDYALCRWGEVNGQDNPAVVTFDYEGVIDAALFENARLIADSQTVKRQQYSFMPSTE